MQFQVGYFFEPEPSKRKTYYKVECVYADESTAVMRPYYPLIKEPGTTFAVPQTSKYFKLSPTYNPLDHQLKYLDALKDIYQEKRWKLEEEINQVKSFEQDIDHRIKQLKGELK